MTPEEVADLRARRYNATVVYLHKTNPDLMVMRVKPDFPRPAHLPGQYGTLGLGYWETRVEGCQIEALKPDEETKVVRRAYSLSCPVEGEGKCVTHITVGSSQKRSNTWRRVSPACRES